MNLLAKIYASVNASLKAHAAGLSAALTLLLADLNTGKTVTADQWYAIVGAYLGAGAVVHFVPNTAKDAVGDVAAVADDTVDDQAA